MYFDILFFMTYLVNIIGGGLAGSEAALSLAARGISVHLYEMRPVVSTPVHQSGDFAELVCSNSLKSTKFDSAAGMLKAELFVLDSSVFATACRHRVAAGSALAVDRQAFSQDVTNKILESPLIEVDHCEVCDITSLINGADALILATGPLTSNKLANSLEELTGSEELAFFDAAAPIVMADSLEQEKMFSQNRYEDPLCNTGDYLNVPFNKEQYDIFIDELVSAKRVIARSFESRDLFQACQPIEEVARNGHDSPRFGALKSVGLIDPHTDEQPWAVLQLRAENSFRSSYNLVGFQTNLTFSEQQRVFRMIPGLEHAEFARFGVMHRNTFIDSPHLLDISGQLLSEATKDLSIPLFVAGQLSGTEGYCEAIRSGLHVAISVSAMLHGLHIPEVPRYSAYGALLSYATNKNTKRYQPMHVNFGIMEPLDVNISNKDKRYHAYAIRGFDALKSYCEELAHNNLLDKEYETRFNQLFSMMQEE